MPRLTVITGASSGIGAELAKRCAVHGDRVVLMARRLDQLDQVAMDIRNDGGLATTVALDVTIHDAVQSAFKEIHDAFGPIDLLVLNAGIGDPTPARSFDAAKFKRVVDVNLIGPANCIESALPRMLENNRGQIVGIGSLAGFRGLPMAGAYCASKSGFAALLESLRLDLRDTGVAVQLITPGFIRTAMTDSNDFEMPFLIELNDATERILRAVRRGDSEYSFPWQLAWPARFARFLPNWAYDKIVSRTRRPR